MKNVTALPTEELFTLELPLTGSNPLWAIRYKSGIETDRVERGDWLTTWEPRPDGIVRFGFSKHRNLFYTDEASANSVAEMLRKNMEIETEVVKAR